MDNQILQGVGKRTRNAFINGKISEKEVTTMYRSNKKEADEFSVFGYKEDDILSLIKSTNNPILRQKLEQYIKERQNKCKKSNEQNIINLEKLTYYKENACGMGLRRVIKHLKRIYRKNKDIETQIITLLLEAEFANLSAKQYKGKEQKIIYSRKNFLLLELSYYLDIAGWKYGINDNTGKNASYIVYVYLPNDIQLCWHSNDYNIYQYYPYINVEWDGLACMTMTKLISYIEEKYFKEQVAA